MKKYDTERFIKFDLKCNPHATQWDAHYIDLAFVASQLNRRLYRQGKVYHINNIYVHDSQGDAEVRFCTAPNTWAVRAAWALGFKNWKKQRALSMEGIMGPSPTGKWSDFKVFLDGNHIANVDAQHKWYEEGANPDDDLQHTYGEGGQLRAITGDGNSSANLWMGEWMYSKFYEPEHVDGAGVDEQMIHLLGPHHKKATIGNTPEALGELFGDGEDLASVGLVAAFEEIMHKASYSGEPNLQTDFEDGVYVRMFDDGESAEEILDDIEDHNDYPPYHPEYIAGGWVSLKGPIQKRACHIATTYSPSVTVGGFSVPLGLLRIETKTSTNNTVGLVIELAAGNYKGLLAEDM